MATNYEFQPIIEPGWRSALLAEALAAGIATRRPTRPRYEFIGRVSLSLKPAA